MLDEWAPKMGRPNPTRPTHGNHLLVTMHVWEREVEHKSTSQPLSTAVHMLIKTADIKHTKFIFFHWNK